MAKKLIKILSIDGGGVRGIIPAVLLAEIEKRTGRSIADCFDLLAGTSTGAIITAGLALPNENGKPKYSAKEAVQFYKKEARNAFKKSLWYTLLHLGNILGPKYEKEGLESVLEKYFGDTHLKDALTELLIPSYELESREAFFFKKAHAVDEDLDFLIKDIVLAASAAPTFFPPKKLTHPITRATMAMIDGGVFANNPAMCALVEAMRMWPKESYLVLSVGTGRLDLPITFNKAMSWGLVKWAQRILGVVFDGITDTVDYQLKKLLPQENNFQYYYRFQIDLENANQDIDDYEEQNLVALEQLGHSMIKKYEKEISELVKLLVL